MTGPHKNPITIGSLYCPSIIPRTSEEDLKRLKQGLLKMRTKLIAIDPGKASGFAVFDISDPEHPAIVYSAELEQFETVSFVHSALAEAASDYEVVMEEFKITPQTGKNSPAGWSLEIIGAIRYFCELYEVPFTLQPPSKAKSFVPNERMKAIGVWHRGGEGHARDALRHGVLYLVEKKGWRPQGLLDVE